MRSMGYRISFSVIFLVFLWTGGALANGASPKNVILLIGDGMGPEQVAAGRLLVPGGELVMDQMDPNPGSVVTTNYFGEITDSAASATAYATGVKTAKVTKPAKAKGAKKGTPTEYPRAESNPFREGSAYAAGYDILTHAGDKGIDRSKLVDEVARITGKEHRKAYFDVTVVCSSRPGPDQGGDGGSHRSIAKASDSFWVEKRNGWVKLHLRTRKF